MMPAGAVWMRATEPLSWLQIVDSTVGIVTAVATVATVLWAAVATRQSEKRANDAEGRERERERAAERAQASRVTVYKGNSEPVKSIMGVISSPAVKVKNASDLPIFAVTVHGSVPETDGVTRLRSRTRPSVPPGDVLDFGLRRPADGLLSEGEEGLLNPNSLAWVAVVFRDANEVDWLRTETGRLARMPDDAEARERLLTECLAEQWTTEALAEYTKTADWMIDNSY